MAANPSGDPTHTRFTSQFHFQLLHAHSQPDLHTRSNRVLMPPPPAPKPPFPAPQLASSALLNLPVKREQEGHHPGSAQTGRADNAVNNPPYQKQSEKGYRNFIPWQMKQEQENHQASADTVGPASNGVSNPPHQKQYQNGDYSIKWQVKQEQENHQCSLTGRSANSGVSNPPYQQRSEKAARHNAKGKMPKNSKACGQKPSDECAHEVSLANNCRYDSSLGLLTRKFVSLVQEAKDGTLDLNRTAEALEVQKRRIYDITNVLEGINLIEKTTKNHVHWKGSTDACPKDIEDELTKLKGEIRSLSSEERRLDDLIRVKQERLRFLEEGEDTQRYLFLTEQDILSIPCFQNHTVIAIKAPHASYIEVPDPDEDTGFSQRQYKMTIKSTTGPIDLYLLSPVEDVAVKQAISEQESNGFQSDAGSSVMSSEDKSDLLMSCDSYVSRHAEGPGMQRITPAICHIEDDYWFQADPAVNITDLWD